MQRIPPNALAGNAANALTSTANISITLGVTREAGKPELIPPGEVPSAQFQQFVESAQTQVDIKKQYARHEVFTELDLCIAFHFSVIQNLIRLANISSNVLREYITNNNLFNIFNESESTWFKNTLLHTFVSNEQGHIVDTILEAAHDHIDPNQVDSEGKNLLILAAKMRNTHLLHQLLSMDFAKKIDIQLRDTFGNSALDYACVLGDVEAVKLLVNNGALENIPDDKAINRLLEMCNSSMAEIKEIFNSVSIDAERDTDAKMNCYDDPLKYGSPPQLFTKDNVQKCVDELPTCNYQVDNEVVKFFNDTLQEMTGKSLLAISLEGQPLVREYLHQQLIERGYARYLSNEQSEPLGNSAELHKSPSLK